MIIEKIEKQLRYHYSYPNILPSTWCCDGKPKQNIVILINWKDRSVFVESDEAAIFKAREGRKRRKLFSGRAPEICMSFFISLWLKLHMHKVRIQDVTQRRSSRNTWSYKLNNCQSSHKTGRLPNFNQPKWKNLSKHSGHSLETLRELKP